MNKPLSILCLLVICSLLFACASDAADVPIAVPPSSDEMRGEVEEQHSNESQEASKTPEPAPDSTPDSAPGQTDDDSEPEAVNAAPATGEVVISFEYTRQTGPASNQHAVWIEDMDGNLVKSLFASHWTATGGYKTRPDSIAMWAERAGLANMQKSEVDAVAGATPGTGPQAYVWDLTDLFGETVLQGDYMFFVEGTLRWKNFVVYSGVITVGDTPVTVQAEAFFHYEGSDRYDALTADSIENNMIGPVMAVFTP